jgi:tetratricopeptide (TPR) repeat protein
MLPRTRKNQIVRDAFTLGLILVATLAAADQDPLAEGKAVVPPALAAVDSLLAADQNEAALFRVQQLQRSHGSSLAYAWQIEERLGVALLRLGQPEEAISHFEAAIQAAPGVASLHQDLGTALMALGRRGRALSEYEQAVALEPENWRLHLDYGQSLVLFRQREPALQQLQEADRLCGSCPEAVRALASLHLEFQDYEAAYPLLERLYAGERTPRMRSLLAEAALQTGRDRRVQELLGPLWSSGINGREAMLLLSADRALNETERARDLVEHPERLTTLADASLWGLVGYLCLEAGCDDEALAAFDRAISLEPDNAVYRNNRVVVLNRLGRRAEAREEWERVLKLTPEPGPEGH